MAGYKDKGGGVVLSFSGSWISWAHTVVAYGKSAKHGLDGWTKLISLQLPSSVH